MKTLHPVYQLLLKIPKGKVTTYGAIGKQLGLNPRHVGQILHKNEGAPKIPCHRVIKSDRTIASGYAFGGPGMQHKMLEREGIKFHNQKVLKTCIISTIMSVERDSQGDIKKTVSIVDQIKADRAAVRAEIRNGVDIRNSSIRSMIAAVPLLDAALKKPQKLYHHKASYVRPSRQRWY